MIYKKVEYIVFLATLAVPLLIYNGFIDDFIPKHIAIIHEISCQGFLQDYAKDLIPGFYAIGAVIVELTGIPSIGLIFSPIQLVPYVLIMICFLNKFSKNYLLSIILAFVYFISGTIGTSKIFFWPHALGEIIFFSMCILSLKIMENPKKEASTSHILLIICGLSLIYISYNLTLMYMLLLISLIIVSYLSKNIDESLMKFLFNFLVILVIMELGLSEFFYKGFLPTIKGIQNIEISGIDKFFLSYFERPAPETFLSDIYLVYPRVISIISIIKYVFLIISIIIFIYVLYKSKKTGMLDLYNLFTVSFLFMNLLFAVLRLYIGGIVITSIYFPAILSTCRLHFLNGIYRLWAILVIIILLITTPLYYYELSSGNLINNLGNYNYIEQSASWNLKYKNECATVSDELTKNFFIFFSVEKAPQYMKKTINYTSMNNEVKILYPDDVKHLLQLSRDQSLTKYFIINYNLNSISLENWISVRSWKLSKYKIDSNNMVNKIYDTSNIAIYY